MSESGQEAGWHLEDEESEGPLRIPARLLTGFIHFNPPGLTVSGSYIERKPRQRNLRPGEKNPRSRNATDGLGFIHWPLESCIPTSQCPRTGFVGFTFQKHRNNSDGGVFPTSGPSS